MSTIFLLWLYLPVGGKFEGTPAEFLRAQQVIIFTNGSASRACRLHGLAVLHAKPDMVVVRCDGLPTLILLQRVAPLREIETIRPLTHFRFVRTLTLNSLPDRQWIKTLINVVRFLL